jgi:uncharacterized protein YbbC (DUF1343 family)
MNYTIGLQRLLTEESLQKKIKGNIGVLCHSATITSNYQHALPQLINVFGSRIKKIFGPQHGFVCDVQDNMIETDHGTHPENHLPIYSLYSETRTPSEDMLDGIDHILVDLSDIGTRVYTYQSTMLQLMQVCERHNIAVTILDRPNPIGLFLTEGNVLEPEWSSFVGRLEIPQRHGLTLGELAQFGVQYSEYKCDLDVITVNNLTRDLSGFDIRFPFINPSPNISTLEGCFTFPGTVLFEGTNISEGRGTTRSLEVFGHPNLQPYDFLEHITPALKASNLTGFELRPIYFHPTFQKHHNKTCGGLHIHPTDPKTFRSWRLTQWLCQQLFHFLPEFKWNDEVYEYEKNHLAIDYINGSQSIRHWIEDNQPLSTLIDIEESSQHDFLLKSKTIHLY